MSLKERKWLLDMKTKLQVGWIDLFLGNGDPSSGKPSYRTGINGVNAVQGSPTVACNLPPAPFWQQSSTFGGTNMKNAIRCTFVTALIGLILRLQAASII